MTGNEPTTGEQRLQPDPDKFLTKPDDMSQADSEKSFEDVAVDEKRQRKACWDRLVADRGKRYEQCRLETFVATLPLQVDAVQTCELYALNVREHYRNGAGLVLYGPRGTGKDHLLVAVAYHAIKESGLRVHWENGVDMFAEVRRAVGNESKQTVESIVRMLSRCDVLAISDPLPPSGTLTEFQQEFLVRVIDRRYSNRLPTWITVNVANRGELETRLSAPIADRLLEWATTVYCNWPTHRKTLREQSKTVGGAA